MKKDRLIGILSLLLREEKTTAPALAERFEVSRRTIQRDIEALCRAGIPVRTDRGTGGGISIMEGYRIDRTLLTSRDMQMILAGLRSLDSIGGSGYYRQLMEKLQTGSSALISGRDSILIDLSSWQREALAPKIRVLQEAIEERHPVRFSYFAPSGESERRAEPYFLIFRWSSWYLWAFCRDREDFRLFKLTRMQGLRKEEETFAPRQVPVPDLSDQKIFPGSIRVRALFHPDLKWRLMEEFGPESFSETGDGRLLFSAEASDMDSLITWLMTFGDRAEVLEPAEAGEEILQRAERMVSLYRKKKQG